MRTIRKQFNLTQAQMAEVLHVENSNNICRYEKGVSAPRLEVLQRLSSYSGYTLDWMIRGGDPSYPAGGPKPARKAREDPPSLVKQQIREIAELLVTTPRLRRLLITLMRRKKVDLDRIEQIAQHLHELLAGNRKRR